MKKTFLFLAMALASVTMSAQTKSINLELLGSSGMAGVNYDSRFKGNSGFGFSVGIGYGYANSGIDFLDTEGNDRITHQVGIPVEINYLFGKNNSHFVLGVGASGLVNIKETSSKPQFGIGVFADIGYRYLKPNGFSFGVGLKPQLGRVLYPYVGIGFSF